MLYATGMTPEDMGKPQVGISSVWYEGNPCNMHLMDLAKEVKRGVVEAGMVGFQFNTIGVSDGISMGTDGMCYSLQSRDLIADSIETVMGAQWYDANISLPGGLRRACVRACVRVFACVCVCLCVALPCGCPEEGGGGGGRVGGPGACSTTAAAAAVAQASLLLCGLALTHHCAGACPRCKAVCQQLALPPGSTPGPRAHSRPRRVRQEHARHAHRHGPPQPPGPHDLRRHHQAGRELDEWRPAGHCVRLPELWWVPAAPPLYSRCIAPNRAGLPGACCMLALVQTSCCTRVPPGSVICSELKSSYWRTAP